MKKFIIKTLGCKVNQCESEAIRNALVESGGGITSGDEGGADVVIVNTCSVTRKAAMQSRQAVRQAIRANPDARIVVTGCHAQTAAAEMAAIDGVDLIVGNRDKHLIPRRILSQLPEHADGAVPTECPDTDRPGKNRIDQFEMLPAMATGSRTRPFLKIQDGCDAYCTYCIVPHARGRSRSLPMDQVLKQIEQLGRLGYREVVLTGIHIGCYGHDLTPATGLIELLCLIREAGSIDRVRVSSIEPAELSDAIIDLACSDPDQSGRLCPHFHIPLQSGDDGILKRMHRPYSRDDFKARVQRIIARLPDAAIGVDTLIGFPGETDAAFEHTYDLIRSLPVAYLHVFPFSAREGTPAFTFKDQVPAPVVKKRCARMRRLGAKKRQEFYARHVGKAVTVLVEATRDRISGCLKGFSDNYIPVLFDGSDDLANTFQPVEIKDISADGVPAGVVFDRTTDG
jgi:threonylcarbamoyladenosine tRNA methylthiotransferase MtaB